MEQIIQLYKKYGDSEYLGECVSKTVHMIQAAYLAEKNNEPDYLVLACLLHDIGHFLEEDNMNGLGVIEHGKVGGDFLRKLGMDEKVCILVENHILAKKYLVSKHQDYYDKLSSPSKKTLEYQGGKMSEEEMKIFEQSDEFDDSIKVRHYDDKGKELGTKVPNLEYFFGLIKKYLYGKRYQTQLETYGYLLIKDFFSEEEAENIFHFKHQLEALPEKKGEWMIYYEEKGGKQFKSRIENFTNYQSNIKDFIQKKIQPFLSYVCKEDMILFKDKMNWKLAGGDGFKAHQDQPAWNDFEIDRFYSVALFGGPCIKENGCLQFVTNSINTPIYNDNGCIPTEIEQQLQWEHIETTPSDLLIFDSYIPHRSDGNHSKLPRSIMYFTFNRNSDGDHYNKYVENKRKHFPPPNEREDGETVQISNNKYNLGNPLK